MGIKSRSNYPVKWGERKIKIMSNAERRKLGLEQDPALPDYQPEFSEKEQTSRASS